MSAGVHLNQPVISTVVGSGVMIGYGQNALIFTGLFVIGNTFDLTINGVPIVQVPFATNHNTTMRNIATSISALASVNAFVVRSGQDPNTKILIEGAVAGVPLVYTGLTIAGGATRPTAQFEPGTSGSIHEQPAILVYTIGGTTDAAILAQVTSKMNRIQGAANYSRVITYHAVGTPGSNPITITHTGTTVIGAETIVETISYNDVTVPGSNATSIVYS